MIHKYLAYLKTIETGSITQAAAALGYTQSAVSRMIADLEEAWNVPLLRGVAASADHPVHRQGTGGSEFRRR